MMWWYAFIGVASLLSSLTEGFPKGPSLLQLTAPFSHPECSTWDSRNNILYFTDSFKGLINSYNYITHEIKSIHLDGIVGPIVPSKVDPNLLVVGLNRSVVAVHWNQQNTTFKAKTLVTVSDDFPERSFNDGKADKNGRLWFRTMSNRAISKDGTTPSEGNLYKITKEGLPKAEVVLSSVGINNGMTWNKANDKFYYIAFPEFRISEYDYDAIQGAISNPRVVFDSENYDMNTGSGGMTIDADDNIWVASCGGGSVIKIDPSTGALLQRIVIPAVCPTSVMWGGPNLDILFVTTSKNNLTEKEFREQPGAGSVYAIKDLGTKGVPTFKADIIDAI